MARVVISRAIPTRVPQGSPWPWRVLAWLSSSPSSRRNPGQARAFGPGRAAPRPGARPAGGGLPVRGQSSAAASSVHPSSKVHSSATLGPFAVVLEGVEIGEGTTIGAGCVIGPDTRIGRDCTIAPNVTISNSTLHERVVILPGARIGQDGFGFTSVRAKDGSGDTITKKPQLLRVQLHDDVEIGANTTVDRGSWRDTTIGAQTKIDNLVQIGHNVVMGKGCLVAAQTGIAGSTTIGDGVNVGGQAGFAQHLTVGSYARIAAKSGVASNLEGGKDYGGIPAVPARALAYRPSGGAGLGGLEALANSLRPSHAILEQAMAQTDALCAERGKQSKRRLSGVKPPRTMTGGSAALFSLPKAIQMHSAPRAEVK